MPFNTNSAPYSPINTTFTINSEGDGTGYNNFLLIVSENITLTLRGNAKFYTSEGVGESSTWNVTTGGEREMLIKNTGGVSELTISDPTKVTRFYFGTGTAEGLPNVPSLNADIGQFTNIVNLAIFTDNGIISGDATLLTDCVEFYIVNNYCTVSGDLSGMVDMTFLEIRGHLGADCATTVTGSVALMTDMYNYWVVSPYNSMYGSITNVGSNAVAPAPFTHFYNSSSLAHFSGSIDSLASLTNFALFGNLHTVTGDITNCPLLNRVGLPSCAINNYTSGKTFVFTLSYDWTINPIIGYGYSTREIDNILADMAASDLTNETTINLLGANKPRSIASDADVTTLEAAGFIVNTFKYPVLESITVETAAPTKVVLTFDQELDESSVPATTDFTVSGKTITAVDVIGNTVELTVSVAFVYGDTSNLTYTLGTNKIQDLDYNLSCNSIASTAIDNNVAPVLGPELVDQAQWFNAAYWSAGFPTGVTTSGGNAINFGAFAGGENIKKTGAAIFENGKTYYVVISYTWNSGADPRFRLPYDGSATYLVAPMSSQINYTYSYASTSDELWITSEYGDVNFTITALSIKEIL